MVSCRAKIRASRARKATPAELSRPGFDPLNLPNTGLLSSDTARLASRALRQAVARALAAGARKQPVLSDNAESNFRVCSVEQRETLVYVDLDGEPHCLDAAFGCALTACAGVHDEAVPSAGGDGREVEAYTALVAIVCRCWFTHQVCRTQEAHAARDKLRRLVGVPTTD